MDPAEHVFYAGSRDGKIYIAALNAVSVATNNYGMHIIGSFSNHRLSFLLCVYFKKYRLVDDVLSLDVSFANMHQCFDCNYLFELRIYFVSLNNLVARIYCLVLLSSSCMIVSICQLQ